MHGLPPKMPVPDWYQFDTGVDLHIWDVWDYPRKNGILRDLKPSDGLIIIPICRVGIIPNYNQKNRGAVLRHKYSKTENISFIVEWYAPIRDNEKERMLHMGVCWGSIL